jgi:thiopurine S-methyltransferase
MSEENSKPPEQRPELPEFWDKRFGTGVMPWDAGGVPAALRDFVLRHPTPLPTLIPGCGSAYEAGWLAEQGWPVTALDFSPLAVDAARRVLGAAPVDLKCADFFNFQPTAAYQLIYERAFLCGLPRKRWVDWAHRLGELLPSGGLLAGFFFVCDQVKGPPFGINRPELDALLNTNFERYEDAAVDDSIPVFAGRERWQVWRRR